MNSILQQYAETDNEPTKPEPLTVRHKVSKDVALILADAAAQQGNLDASNAWLEMAESCQ